MIKSVPLKVKLKRHFRKGGNMWKIIISGREIPQKQKERKPELTMIQRSSERSMKEARLPCLRLFRPQSWPLTPPLARGTNSIGLLLPYFP